jgi:hypothetical protein
LKNSRSELTSRRPSSEGGPGTGAEPYASRERLSSTAQDLVTCGLGLLVSGALIETGVGAFAFAMQIAKCQFDLGINLAGGSQAERNDAKKYDELLSVYGWQTIPYSMLLSGGDKQVMLGTATAVNLISDYKDFEEKTWQLADGGLQLREVFALGVHTNDARERIDRLSEILFSDYSMSPTEHEPNFSDRSSYYDDGTSYIGDDPGEIDQYIDPPGMGDVGGSDDSMWS